MSHVPAPSASALRALYAISRMHTGIPLFKILDPPLYIMLVLPLLWVYFVLAHAICVSCALFLHEVYTCT